MKILVIDNYDSFVFNLVHILHELGFNQIDVRKNDQIILKEVDNYDKILLSPGPGLPKNAGIMPEIIKTFGTKKSILGVCLGHQAIAESFGGKLINLKEPLHGIASAINIKKTDYLFDKIPTSYKIGHYHSWVVANDLPAELECIATDSNQNIMAIRHKTYDLRGVQFHPESVLTEYGKQLIYNWANH